MSSLNQHYLEEYLVGLSPVRLCDKSVFDAAFSHLKEPLSDYTFAMTFIWGKSLEAYWGRIHQHLCVFTRENGSLSMLMPPIPEAGANRNINDFYSCISCCFEIMDRYNDRFAHRSESRIEYVSEEFLNLFKASGWKVDVTLMYGDYIYDIAQMIDLAGAQFKSKRHARNKFVRDFPNYRTEQFVNHHKDACLALLDLWSKTGNRSDKAEENEENVRTNILRHREVISTQCVLQYYDALNLSGMVLLVEDNLVGFTLGESITPNQASIIIEKTHPQYPGSAQFIFSEFCRQNWSGLQECNAGDDWGIPSLRFTKQSYRPIRMLNKYQVKQKLVFSLAYPNSSCIAVKPPGVEFRTAFHEDIDAILNIEELSFQFQEEKFNRRQIRNLIHNARATVTVAELNGSVVAWAASLVRQHRRGRSGRLYAIAVAPVARRKKIGQQLVEHTLKSLFSTGVESISLEVRCDNEAAISLYRKLNFQDHAILPDYYGQGRPAVRMKLLIANCSLPLAISIKLCE